MSPFARVIVKNLLWRFCVQIPVFTLYRLLAGRPTQAAAEAAARRRMGPLGQRVR